MVVTISLDVLSDISRQVVLEYGHGLQIVGVTSSDRDTARVELLITISGCHSEPCRFVINLSRADRAQFERELKSKLLHAISTHQSTI